MTIAKFSIIAGVLILCTGIACLYADKISWLGHLPGDLTFKGKNVTFYVPLTTSIILSLLLSLILYGVHRQ